MTLTVNNKEERLAWQKWKWRRWGWWWWCQWWIYRGEYGKLLFWVRCKGGGGHLSPAMQCCTASANQLSAERERRRGQSLTTAKESSRSDTARENKWEREAVVVRASGLVLNSRFSAFSPFSILIFTTRFSVKPLISSSSVTLAFTPGPIFPWFHFVFLCPLCGVIGFSFFLNTYTLFCPPPLHHCSHGHPCILQVRAAGVCEFMQMW